MYDYEAIEMRCLLLKYGFASSHVDRLRKEGMGPHELEHRLQTGQIEGPYGITSQTRKCPMGSEVQVLPSKYWPRHCVGAQIGSRIPCLDSLLVLQGF